MSSPNTGFRVVNQEDGSVSVSATYFSKEYVSRFRFKCSGSYKYLAKYSMVCAKVFAAPQGVNVEVPINVVIIIEFNVEFSDVQQVVDA